MVSARTYGEQMHPPSGVMIQHGDQHPCNADIVLVVQMTVKCIVSQNANPAHHAWTRPLHSGTCATLQIVSNPMFIWGCCIERRLYCIVVCWTLALQLVVQLCVADSGYLCFPRTGILLHSA
jgi:hypothetical protein